MANPNIASPSSVYGYQFSVKLDAATAQNILANKALSGTLISWSLDLWNIDGTNDVDVTIAIYDEDGTGICSNTGTGEATTGTDVVAGTDLGGAVTVPVAADSGIREIAGGYLNEDQSVVITASAANDLSAWIKYTVLS